MSSLNKDFPDSKHFSPEYFSKTPVGGRRIKSIRRQTIQEGILSKKEASFHHKQKREKNRERKPLDSCSLVSHAKSFEN